MDSFYCNTCESYHTVEEPHILSGVARGHIDRLTSKLLEDRSTIASLTAERDDAFRTIKKVDDAFGVMRDERDALKAALESIAKSTCCHGCTEAARVARVALRRE